MRPCADPEPPRRARGRLPRGARRARPARRRAGDRRACRPDRRSSARRRPPRRASAAARGASTRRGGRRACPDRGRACPRARCAPGSTTAFGRRRRAAGRAPAVDACHVRRRRGVGRGHRGRRDALRERLEGCYGDARGRPRGRRRAPDATAGPRPARRRSRIRDGPATRCSSRSSRCGGRSTATSGPTASPYRALHPRVTSPLGGRRLPDRRQRARRSGSRPATSSGGPTATLDAWRDAVDEPGRAARRAADRAVGLVVAGRRGRARARRRAPARPRASTSTAASTPRSAPTSTRWASAFDTDAAAGPAARPGRVHDVRRAAAPPRRRHLVDRARRRCSRRYVDGGLGDLSGARPRDRARDPHRGDPDAARRSPTGRTPTRSPRRSRSSSALDVAEPAWQRRWIPRRRRLPDATVAPLPLRRGGARRRVGPVRDPAPRRPGPRPRTTSGPRSPSTYLGIAPHPEWSWWAMRGQLVQEPGYMANYAVGRGARGGPAGGDPRRRAATGSTATRAGTRGSRSASTGSGRSGRRATSCATCSGAPRPRPRCSPRSRGRGRAGLIDAPRPRDQRRSAHPVGRPLAGGAGSGCRRRPRSAGPGPGRRRARVRPTRGSRAASRCGARAPRRRSSAGSGRGRRTRAVVAVHALSS